MTNPFLSRREFLATTSIALAAVPLAGRRLLAAGEYTPSATPYDLFPAQLEGNALRGLAAMALEAARQAGASYADIRIADEPAVTVGLRDGNDQVSVILQSRLSYGIRVIVDGTVAFAYGSQPTSDAVARAARNAVASARGITGRLRTMVELAPAPAVTGDWEGPLTTDPFAIPLREQGDVLGAYCTVAHETKDVGIDSGVGFTWRHKTRVFASTEGTMLSQRFCQSSLYIPVTAEVGSGQASLHIDGQLNTAGGFERAIDPDLHQRIRLRADEVVRLAALPVKVLDVGRYDVVLSGAATGMLLRRTLGAALELDRAIGEEASATGTSFLAPPLDLLGTDIVSPLVTLTSDRTAPAFEAAKWDDDGVLCHPVSLIERGRLTNYLTTRMTVSAIRPWLTRHEGHPLESNGSSIAPDPDHVPLARPGHLAMAANPNGGSLEDLCARVKRGILSYGGFGGVDQSLASGQIGTNSPPTPMYQIDRGQVVVRVHNTTMQYMTKRLWSRTLTAIGGPSTIGHDLSGSAKSQPVQYDQGTVTAPAALFTDLDVVQFGGTI